MDVKILFDDEYQIVGVMEDGSCHAEEFILNGEASTQAARAGIYKMLKHTATVGLANLPFGWVHEANKQDQVYEFIKGPLRLFFFKGSGKQIVVCTVGTRKTGNKADKPSVSRSKKFLTNYFDAANNGSLNIIEE